MLKLLDKILFILNLIVLAGLLGAYTSSYVNPNTFVLPSLLGLAYPYLLIINLIFLFYWIVRLKKRALIVLGVILLGIPTFMTYYGTADTEAEVKNPEPDLRILSYNIRYFDIYNWSGRKNTRTKLFEYLNRFQGDVLCLQEFSNNEAVIKNTSIVRQLKSYPYHYIHKDMAIFSRKRILHTGTIPFEKRYTSSCIYLDLLVAKDTVRIYSVHLESYNLGKQERKFMKEMSEGLKSEEITEGMKNILSRIVKANKNRAKQAEQIRKHIIQSPHPVVLCGDFNDTPLSYTYKKIKGNLQDSFIERGKGLGNTYIGEFPSFRIDYILHTPSFKTLSYKRDKIVLSDHYPITAELKIAK